MKCDWILNGEKSEQNRERNSYKDASETTGDIRQCLHQTTTTTSLARVGAGLHQEDALG